MPDKHLYGQGFALYGLSEYAIASGDSSATALAQQLFGILEDYAYDSQYGGYREFFLRDWTSIQYGFDRKDGEFYDSGYDNSSANSFIKIWWVQAEALVAALRLYHLTKEELYYHCFCRTLNWIVKHQVDWKNGDWHNEIRTNGQPWGDKAGSWKSPYHHGRAILKCLELIP